MTAQNPTQIRETVREHYAAAARGASCCGGPGENTLYPVNLMTEMPGEVANFSLGCGDPITLAGLQPGEIVLDLGSGGGLDCFLAARKVGKDVRVIGVDMTSEMLERARMAAVRLGYANVEFRQGYLENLPVDSDSVDVVISNCVINLSPDKPQVFREVLRVLKPGGRLAVSDIVTNGPLPEELKNDMNAWGACIAGALNVSEYVQGLSNAGFTSIKVQPKGEVHELLDAVALRGSIFSATITAVKPG